VGRTETDRQPWERTTGLDGLIVTPNSYAHVAFVTVYSGGAAQAAFPVAIEDDLIVPYRMDLSAEDIAAGDDAAQRDRWVERTRETLDVIRGRFKLNDVGTPQAILALARQAVKTIPTEIARLTEERKELLVAAGQRARKLDLSEGDANIRRLEAAQARYARDIPDMEDAIQQNAVTQRLRTVLVRARALEGQAEFAEAIKLYESVLAQRPDSQEVKAHLEKLRAAWQTRDNDHVKAREFIYQEWLRVEPAALKIEVERAFKALAVCRAHGDRLTVRKLRHVNEQHAAQLTGHLKAVSREADSEDSRARTNNLLAAGARLRQLQAEVTAFLSPGKSEQRPTPSKERP
jgi:hypothetical protein